MHKFRLRATESGAKEGRKPGAAGHAKCARGEVGQLTATAWDALLQYFNEGGDRDQACGQDARAASAAPEEHRGERGQRQ